MKINFLKKSGFITQRGRAAIAVLLACSPAAQAHPGHLLIEAPPAHLLTNSDHCALLLLLGGVAWCSAQLVQQRFPRRTLQWCGATALFGALVIRGLRL